MKDFLSYAQKARKLAIQDPYRAEALLLNILIELVVPDFNNRKLAIKDAINRDRREGLPSTHLLAQIDATEDLINMRLSGMNESETYKKQSMSDSIGVQIGGSVSGNVVLGDIRSTNKKGGLKMAWTIIGIAIGVIGILVTIFLYLRGNGEVGEMKQEMKGSKGVQVGGGVGGDVVVGDKIIQATQEKASNRDGVVSPKVSITFEGKNLEGVINTRSSHQVADRKCLLIPLMLKNTGKKTIKITNVEIQTTHNYLSAGSGVFHDGENVMYREMVLFFKYPSFHEKLDYPVTLSPGEHRNARFSVCKGTWKSGKEIKESETDNIINTAYDPGEKVPLKLVLFSEECTPLELTFVLVAP